MFTPPPTRSSGPGSDETAPSFNGTLALQFAKGFIDESSKVELEHRSKLGLLKQKAESGDAQAQYTFAQTCLRGQKRVDMLTKSAEQGYAESQVALGDFYRNASISGAVNPLQSLESSRKASEWYRKAAAQGDFFAQCHLASVYREISVQIDTLRTRMTRIEGMLEQKENEHLYVQCVEVLKQALIWSTKASLHGTVPEKICDVDLKRIKRERDAIAASLKQVGIESVNLESTVGPELLTPQMLEISKKFISKFTPTDPREAQMLQNTQQVLALAASKMVGKVNPKKFAETKDDRAPVAASEATRSEAQSPAPKTSSDEAQSTVVKSGTDTAETQTHAATEVSASESTTSPVVTVSSIRPPVR